MKRTAWRWILCLLVAGAVSVLSANSLFAKSAAEKGEVKGSVSVPGEAVYLSTLAKVSLVDAVTAALKNTPGKAVSAELDADDGFLVYTVAVVEGNSVTEVTVDAGNGKVLKTKVAEDEDDDDEDQR